MHEPSESVIERRSLAFADVDGFISGIPGAGRLPERILDLYQSGGYCRGWQVPVDFSDGVRRDLYVLVNTDFPYVPPRIVVPHGPHILAWPHLESEGFLCVLPNDAAVSSQDPAGVVEYVLGEACRLIEDSINGRNVEDFRQEFLSYWELAASSGSPKYISLLEPHGPGRRVYVWRGQNRRVVGENPQSVEKWLTRWGAKKVNGQGYKLHEGVLIWLPEPLVPGEYPHTAADVRSLARVRSSEAADVLEGLAVAGVHEIDVLLGARTANGACFAAV
ncbi:MAG: E2/UBC family protein, partial [Gammaproteobacteria bacterium]